MCPAQKKATVYAWHFSVIKGCFRLSMWRVPHRVRLWITFNPSGFQKLHSFGIAPPVSFKAFRYSVNLNNIMHPSLSSIVSLMTVGTLTVTKACPVP